jgi:hypothetical protein
LCGNIHWQTPPIEHLANTAELFDRDEINRLFATGYELGLSADAWRTDPPGLNHPDAQL